MRRILIWTGAAVVAAAVVFAAIHFRNQGFPGSRSAAQSHWVPMLPPPAKRAWALAHSSVRKEFGPWHLGCMRQQTTPKVGFIQNLGIVPQTAASKARPCQVTIMMRNEAASRQTMTLAFRYSADNPNPEVFVHYITVGRPNVLYAPTGQVIVMDKKKKARGGSYIGQFASKNSDYEETRAQDVHLQLAGHDFAIPTQVCIHANCNAHYAGVDVSGIGRAARIVVRLPGPAHGQRRDVDLPTEGLASALAELRRLSTS